MKGLMGILMTLLLVLFLAVGVSAATEATGVIIVADVASDGSCDISVAVSMHIEGTPEEFVFPVPADARDVRVNGTAVTPTAYRHLQRIDLSAVMGVPSGDITFRVQYALPDILSVEEKNTVLVLPLLSGFGYPISQMQLQVNMPAEGFSNLNFTSGYYQTRIEETLSVTVSGSQISVISTDGLQDNETLILDMKVDPAMFPDRPEEPEKLWFDTVAMIVCGILALLYWVLFLRLPFVRRQDTTLPPEGFGAGEIGSVLTLQEADLTMMVFSWAQLGYILIQVDRHGRVLLHKRLDMGNERSSFERKFYRALFGKKTVADTSSPRYAMLCKKARRLSPNVRALIQKRGGNPLLFRVLACGVAAFGGVSVGLALTAKWFPLVLLAVAGGVSGWFIHRWTDSLLLRKGSLWSGLLVSGSWLLVCGLTDTLWTGIAVILSQLLAGTMITYGCRRTDTGLQALSQVLGLRHYLRTLSREDVKRLQSVDPEYFHNMAPYALALGVDRSFAKCFGSDGIAACPYLTGGMDGHMSAREWSDLMRRTVKTMEAGQRTLPLERLRARFGK